MVVILDDQLLHLADTVLMRIRVRTHHTDKRDLRPYDKSHLITGIVKVLRMLIMRKPDGIRAQLLDEPCILIMVFPVQRISFIKLILMTAHAA